MKARYYVHIYATLTVLIALSITCEIANGQVLSLSDRNAARILWSHGIQDDDTDKTESGMPTKPLYRPENKYPGEVFDEAREIMDEVIRNRNGKDDFLNGEEAQRLFEKTDIARKFLVGNSTEHRNGFHMVFEEMKTAYQEAIEKSRELNRINMSIENDLVEMEKEFNRLAEGDEAIIHILKGLGWKVGGFALGKAIESGSQLMKSLHAGKLIGVAGAVLGMYQYCLVADEYTKMQPLMEDLLELMELRAYVRGLNAQYDALVKELYDDIGELEELRNVWLDQAPQQRRGDLQRLVYMAASGTGTYQCPDSFFLTGVYYADSDGGNDKRVMYLRCSRMKNVDPKQDVLESLETKTLKMNSNGTDWYDCPEGNPAVGAFYSNSDYSIERLNYVDLKDLGLGEQCKISVGGSASVQMRGNGTGWYNCQKDQFVTGAYYRDDDTEPDDSIEAIRCSHIVVECR